MCVCVYKRLDFGGVDMFLLEAKKVWGKGREGCLNRIGK